MATLIECVEGIVESYPHKLDEAELEALCKQLAFMFEQWEF